MHSIPRRAGMQGASLRWHRHVAIALGNGDPSVYASSPTVSNPRAMSWRLLVPTFITIAAAAIANVSQLDLRLADALYAWEGGQWALRWTYPTEQVLHVAGRNASACLWMLVVACCAASRIRPGWRAWQRPLACLALSVLLSTALVAWIKSWSNVDCPWDLVRYGGGRLHVDLFSARPAGMPRGACFPAGHASGGYAWTALYFFFIAVRPAWRRYGLGIGLGLGLAFGVSQQLRGAHFLSHDLWTAALCWLTAVAVHAAARQPLQPDGAADPAHAIVQAPAP